MLLAILRQGLYALSEEIDFNSLGKGAFLNPPFILFFVIFFFNHSQLNFSRLPHKINDNQCHGFW